MTNRLKGFHPTNVINAAQNLLIKTQKSSGFNPLLIFVLFCFCLAFGVMEILPDTMFQNILVSLLIGIPVISFVLLFAHKCRKDPGFCRSETHLENIRKLELKEQKGDPSPQIIDIHEVPRQGRIDENRHTASPKALNTSLIGQEEEK